MPSSTPDYKKGDDGSRSVGNGVNNDVIMHRLYGVVSLNDKLPCKNHIEGKCSH